MRHMFKCGNCFGGGGMSGGRGLGIAGGGNRQGLNMKLALLEATSEQNLKMGRVETARRYLQGSTLQAEDLPV